MRIAYFGLPLGAVLLERAGFPLAVASIGHPDAIGTRRLRRTSRALLLGRPALDHAGILHALEGARPDAILSWFWPTRPR